MSLNLHGESTFSSCLPVDDPDSIRLFTDQAPVKKAVIIAAGNGSRLEGYQNGSPKPLLRVGGLHLLERVILSAKRAGIKEFVIVIGYQAARIRKTINTRKLGVKITWVRNIDWRQPNGMSVLKAERFVDEKFLLCMSDHIFDHKILEKVRNVSLNGDSGMLCVDYNLNRIPNLDDATKVRTANNRLVNLDKSLTDFNAIDTGIFVCTPDLFEALRQSQDKGDFSLSGGIRVLAQEGRMCTYNIGTHFWQDVDTVPDARFAEKLLLKSTRSEGDGIIAKTINRKISNRITKWLLKTPVTPNQISIFNLIFAVFTAWLVSFGEPLMTIIGGLLFQFGSILDGCDGEVAVVKLRDSRAGAKVDTITDHLSYMSFVIGVSIGAYNATGSPVIFAVTCGVLMLLVCALNIGRLFIKKKNTASLRALDSAIGDLDHPGQKVWYLKYLAKIHHMGRRDLFSFSAMLVMLTGNITLFYWMLMTAVFLMSTGIIITTLSMLSNDN